MHSSPQLPRPENTELRVANQLIDIIRGALAVEETVELMGSQSDSQRILDLLYEAEPPELEALVDGMKHLRQTLAQLALIAGGETSTTGTKNIELSTNHRIDIIRGAMAAETITEVVGGHSNLDHIRGLLQVMEQPELEILVSHMEHVCHSLAQLALTVDESERMIAIDIETSPVLKEIDAEANPPVEPQATLTPSWHRSRKRFDFTHVAAIREEVMRQREIVIMERHVAFLVELYGEARRPLIAQLSSMHTERLIKDVASLYLHRGLVSRPSSRRAAHLDLFAEGMTQGEIRQRIGQEFDSGWWYAVVKAIQKHVSDIYLDPLLLTIVQEMGIAEELPSRSSEPKDEEVKIEATVSEPSIEAGPLVEPVDEHVAQWAREGNYDALVKRYYGVMKKEARFLSRNHPEGFDAALSAAFLGLRDAAQRFDPTKGVAFMTFLVPRIRGAIRDDIRNFIGLNRTSGEIEISLRSQTTSFDAPVHDIGVLTRQDVIADHAPGPEEVIAETDLKQKQIELMRRALDCLEERDRVIIALRLEGLSLAEIGKALEVTESRICQIIPRIISKLRKEIVDLMNSEGVRFDASEIISFDDATSF